MDEVYTIKEFVSELLRRLGEMVGLRVMPIPDLTVPAPVDVVLPGLSYYMPDVAMRSEDNVVMRFIDQPDGKVRWIAWPSAVAILNRQNEVDTTALFDGFIERGKKTGDYGYLTFCHQSEKFRLGSVDWMERDGYLLLESGLLDDSEISRAMRKSVEENPGYWGTSIGFLPLERDLVSVTDGMKIPMYTRGLKRETSVVPEEFACHWLTSFGISDKEEVVRMKNEKLQAALRKLAGDDDKLFEVLVKRAEGNEELNRSIEDRGLIRRDDEAKIDPEVKTEPVVEVKPEVKVEETKVEPESEKEVVADETLVTEICDRMVAEDGPLAALVAAAVTKAIEGLPTQAVLDEVKRVAKEEQDKLVLRLAKLEGEEEIEKQEVIRNAPRKLVAPSTRVIFRNTQRQVVRETVETENPTFAEIASETLAGMKK